MELFPQSIAEFYRECARLTKWEGYARDYLGQAASRERDCYYAEKVMGYERVPLSKTKTYENGEPLAKFNFIFNPMGSPLNANYIIAPCTRVRHYSTSLSDALELARKIGLTSIPLPAFQGLYDERKASEVVIEQILKAADEWIAARE